jgi:RNA polymerase sigma-70 factor (ECF subfamily)
MSADAHERFTRLFLAHEPEIQRVVTLFVPHRPDARDVLQETAVALWRHFGEYDPDRPFVPWACGFARNEVRRFLRERARQRHLTERAAELLMATAEHRAADVDVRDEHLRDCLARLPADLRALVGDYYRADQPVADLARRSGRTADAVYKSLQRVRKLLLECVQGKIAAEAR